MSFKKPLFLIFLLRLQSMREGEDMTEREIYDMLLTQAEIQGNISAANGRFGFVGF